eukprot:365445-Chlamydomonas_euryale.AAC.21
MAGREERDEPAVASWMCSIASPNISSETWCRAGQQVHMSFLEAREDRGDVGPLWPRREGGAARTCRSCLVQVIARAGQKWCA